MIKILITILLMLLAVPVAGMSLGAILGYHRRFFGVAGADLVLPAILVLWGAIIYCIWF